MNRRSFAKLLSGSAIIATSFSRKSAAQAPCDHYFVQEQANESLSTTYGENACPGLPTLAEITPPGLKGAILDEYFGGSGKNGIAFNSGRSVTLAGQLDWRPRRSDYPAGWCTKPTWGGPAEGHLEQRAPVFITSTSATPLSYDDREIEDALCWVWDGESEPINVNLWLVEHGTAVWNPETTPKNLWDAFEDADSHAREEKIGMWGSCPDPETREPILTSYFPKNKRPSRVASVSGKWGKAANFTIETPDLYQATAIAANANTYIEIAVLRNLDTGQEYPEFYWTIFGPQTFSTQLWLEAGTYLFDCRAAGNWFFHIETIPR